MVFAAAGSGGIPGWIGSATALLAVAVGIFYRQSAVLAVLVTATGLVFTGASVMFAAASGLSATAYLVIRYAAPRAGGSGATTMTGPTAIGMVGFTLVAAAAAVIPWRLAWVPFLAPVLVFGILVVTWVVSAAAPHDARSD